MGNGVTAPQSQLEGLTSALRVVPASRTNGEQENLFPAFDVMVEDEIACRSGSVARVKIYHNGVLVVMVEGRVESEQGADEGYYPVVKLKRVDI